MLARQFTHAFAGALCISFALAIALPSTAVAAQQSVSSELGKPVSAAQDAIKKKQWPQALESIKAAQALAKTPRDSYAVDTLLAYVLNEQKNYAEAVKVYERLLNSPLTPPNQVNDRTVTIAQMYYRMDKFTEAANWSKKALDKSPQDQAIAALLGDSYYQLHDYKNAAATMLIAIANAEHAGKQPDVSWLRIVHVSYEKLGNTNGVIEVLKKLVRTFQEPADWDLLLRASTAKLLSDPVRLGYYRLMLDTGTLKRPTDYVEMAQLAIDAGVPDEARQVMETGFKNGRLKTDNKTEQGKYDRLLASTKTQAADNRTALPKLAAAATNGNAYATLGQVYTSYGNYDQAISALQQALKQTDLSDPDQAQINLGIAHAKKGQKDAAHQAFKAVKKSSKWADLAELWALRI